MNYQIFTKLLGQFDFWFLLLNNLSSLMGFFAMLQGNSPPGGRVSPTYFTFAFIHFVGIVIPIIFYDATTVFKRKHILVALVLALPGYFSSIFAAGFLFNWCPVNEDFVLTWFNTTSSQLNTTQWDHFRDLHASECIASQVTPPLDITLGLGYRGCLIDVCLPLPRGEICASQLFYSGSFNTAVFFARIYWTLYRNTGESILLTNRLKFINSDGEIFSRKSDSDNKKSKDNNISEADKWKRFIDVENPMAHVMKGGKTML